MMQQTINSPLISSCGRLFDALAALMEVRQKVNYEAQAAIELETSIDPSAADTGYALTPQGDTGIMSTPSMFEALLDHRKEDVSVADMSRRLRDGLIQVFAEPPRALWTTRSRNAGRIQCVEQILD
jgi:hydrogenase maturation protein HypF